MRDLYLKRNELNEKSQKLRVAKFDPTIKRDMIDKLIRKQKEIIKGLNFMMNI